MTKIVIDPGHGAPDPGAVGQNGLHEADVVLGVALKVRDLLSNHTDIEIIMTRETDERPGTSASNSLQKRATLANTEKADYFISIHNNSAANTKANGTLVFIDAAGGQAEVLANKLANALAIEIPQIPCNGVKVAKEFLKNNLYVLHYTTMPAALIELGFISNAENERLLGLESTQTAAARAIAKAILEQTGGDPILADEQILIDLQNPSDWAKDGWQWATDQHLIDGTRPHDGLTREEFAVILNRFYNLIK